MKSILKCGATAADDKDGDLTSSIIVSGTVDEKREGTYTITYKVKDSSGNETTVQRVIKVEDKRPTITLNGEKTVTLNVGDKYKEENAKASDEIDGELKVNICGTVDETKAGTYIITYTAKNSRNKEVKATREVIVKPVPETNNVNTNEVVNNV